MLGFTFPLGLSALISFTGPYPLWAYDLQMPVALLGLPAIAAI